MNTLARALTNKRTLTLLLVLTVLVSRGFCTAIMQQYMPMPASSAEEHPSYGAQALAGEEEKAPDSGDTSCFEGLDYTYTLTLVLAVAWLLLGGMLGRRNAPVPSSLRVSYPLAALPRPRGPTFSILQVFRL